MPFTPTQAQHIRAMLEQHDVEPVVRETIEHLASSEDTTAEDGVQVIRILDRSKPSNGAANDPVKVRGNIFR